MYPAGLTNDGSAGAAEPAAFDGRREAGRAIRVVLGEGEFLIREGITRILERLGEVELVASCRDLAALREAIRSHRPDVVVTDISLPPGHANEGLELAGELRTTDPDVGVVVLSREVKPLHAVSFFASGSARRAYLLTDRLEESGELARSIREVAAGRGHVDPRVVDELLAAREQEAASLLGALTARERETLALVAAGHSNDAIAAQLAITRRGVERHVSAIFTKLGLSDAGDVSPRVKAALLYLDDERRRPR
jgi:DNA-binding NarL/FixJ family response regulator